MQSVFGNWKYIVKNLWYVVGFGVIPAIFYALSFDYTATHTYLRAFFSGAPNADFLTLFRILSPIRVDHVVGGLYSIFSYLVTVVFATLLMAFTEKHMRIGKRTLSGVSDVFLRMLLPTAFVVFLMYALGVVCALIFAAVGFVISQIQVAAAVYILTVLVMLASALLFLYLLGILYLWLPGIQITGFGLYHAFLYSYRLMTGIRAKLILSQAISFSVLFAVMTGVSFLPEIVFRTVAFALCLCLFLSFFIRMETTYFYTDKIDREDVLKSYREL